MDDHALFDESFKALTGHPPFPWQRRLFREFVGGRLPSALDLPTGLGKTSVMAIWLAARALGGEQACKALPRRLVYVVDRRAVVDQATEEAEKLRRALDGEANHFSLLNEQALAEARRTAAALKSRLGFDEKGKLPISTLRGAYVDNREWLDDPVVPAIIVGTVDMIGSRLLFEGYGVSRKMRPYHAGLLGADTLVVLDEAHLVPPFAHLLRAIEQDSALCPKDEADRAILPRFAVLPLSATQRDSGEHEHKNKHERVAFHLKEEDWKIDCVVEKRLKAKKHLSLQPLADSDQDKQLAGAAWALATKDGKFSRVVVFCERRDKKEDIGGPSAQGVKEAIERLVNADKKAGRPGVEIHRPELLVGARRVREREKVERSLRDLGFIGKKDAAIKPTFLIATSAGEVGIDLDADHMVSDLVAWERMVQRLGRVNRRGEGDAEIKVFWSKPSVKDAKALTESERRALTAFASKTVIEKLPPENGGFKASPSALRQLSESARNDAALKALIDEATTPEPLRPALNRPLVDAWSMTSLKVHTGRPQVAPWLRGWVDDAPQTAIVWRTYLPIRFNERGGSILPRKTEIEDFFEAASPHESEKLETETYRVASWLQERANALLKHKQRLSEKGAEDEDAHPPASAAVDTDFEEPPTEEQATGLRSGDIVVLVLSSSGDYAGRYTLGELSQDRKGKVVDEFRGEIAGKTLVIDARFGGLKDGLLEPSANGPPESADSFDAWSREVRFRVRRVVPSAGGGSRPSGEENGWHFEDDFDLCRNDEGIPLERLVIEHFRAAAQKEDARSIAEPQELAVHQDLAERRAEEIGRAVGLSGTAVEALALAASVHDEGKRAGRWQRAFKAPREKDELGAYKIFAKTLGPINQAILDGYRHEFGSLAVLEPDHDWAKPLSVKVRKQVECFRNDPDWLDLLLHLVASHHGGGRPVISMRGCEDGPPSLLEGRARAVALCFARLQKRWGPWGLAWWHEHVFLAADDSDGDGQVDRFIVAAPWACDRTLRRPNRAVRAQFDAVVSTLETLRAGRLGVVALGRPTALAGCDALLGPARVWESRTPYLATRHAGRGKDATAALACDVTAECKRRGLPVPAAVEILEFAGVPNGGGLKARARLRFATAVDGPLLLGRDSHGGGGMFASQIE